MTLTALQRATFTHLMFERGFAGVTFDLARRLLSESENADFVSEVEGAMLSSGSDLSALSPQHASLVAGLLRPFIEPRVDALLAVAMVQPAANLMTYAAALDIAEALVSPHADADLALLIAAYAALREELAQAA